MTIPVQDIAKFIIQNSERISNLKLQKLLYYVQGWRLGLTGEPLFKEEVQAWVHGPVVPSVFSRYRHYKWNPIDIPDEAELLTDDESAQHTLRVIGAYGKLSATQLEQLSHRESPWINARAGLPLDMPSRNEISHESMRDYFGSLSGQE